MTKRRKDPSNEGAGPASEDKRRQRLRSLAIALSLALLVILFYTATIVRLGGNVFNRPL